MLSALLGVVLTDLPFVCMYVCECLYVCVCVCLPSRQLSLGVTMYSMIQGVTMYDTGFIFFMKVCVRTYACVLTYN